MEAVTAFSEVSAKFGRMKPEIRTTIINALRIWLILSLCLFSLFMLFAAPYELSQVEAVRHWPQVPARIIDSGYRLSDFSPYRFYGYFHFRDVKSGKDITTSDVRPGDLPFSIGAGPFTLMDTMRDDLKAYGGGRVFMARRSPDGRKYFLEAGDPGLMRFIFALCVAWWGYVGVYSLRRKRK